MSTCCGKVIYEGLCKRGRPVKVLDCAVCGYKHLDPLPDAQALADYYREEYFATEKPDYAATSGTESEYQKLVDEDKIKAALGPGLPTGPYGKGHTVLDYGCGPSAPFLKHFKEIVGGTQTIFGLEPSQEEESKCINVRDQVAVLVNDLDAFPGKADIIHLGFVLEHVANPVSELLKLKPYLASGGRLIIEVPNDFSPLQEHLWSKLGGVPWWVSSPDHVNYFNFRSLSEALHRAGFRVRDAGTTYPVELFLAHGADFRTDPAAGKAVVELRADLQRLWRHVGTQVSNHIGRTVWIVAEART